MDDGVPRNCARCEKVTDQLCIRADLVGVKGMEAWRCERCFEEWLDEERALRRRAAHMT